MERLKRESIKIIRDTTVKIFIPFILDNIRRLFFNFYKMSIFTILYIYILFLFLDNRLL